MSKVQFRKATKEQAKLRLALFGPSGSGKTLSALRIATGIGGNIAIIDTERGSASKYANHPEFHLEFDVFEPETKNIATYCAAIQAASDAGYNVLIIDSLTHAWKKLLEQIDKIAKTKYGGNTWAAWSDGTPRQNKLVDTILNCNCHIIATMRSKTEWAVNQDKGKTRPVRIGLAPEQGKGIEYEFDMLMEISAEHNAVVIKDRTGKYQDKMIELPDEEFGQSLADWLQDGAQPTQKKTQPKQQPRRTQPQQPASRRQPPEQPQHTVEDTGPFDPSQISDDIMIASFYGLVLEHLPYYKNKNHIVNAYKKCIGDDDAVLCRPNGVMVDAHATWAILSEHANAGKENDNVN